MLLHTKLHIFHSSENYWLGYVNSPATRPTTYIHFSNFILKAVLQCIYNYIKFITKKNCYMFPRKEACPYHLWHSKWSYCLYPDGYIQHLWGNHSTVSSSLHSGQLNQHTDIPEIYMYRNRYLWWNINKTTCKYTCAIKTCKKTISL